MEVLAKQLQHTYRHCFRRNRSSKPAASSPAAQVSYDDLRSARLTPWLRPELCSFPAL